MKVPPQQRLPRVEKCREMSRNVEKCRGMSRNVEFCQFCRSRSYSPTSSDFDVERGREMSRNVAKCRKMSKNVEFCRILSKSLLGGDLYDVLL